MATTKRPQNKCKSCSYTWYPRGKSVSHKCPNCGSKEVAIKWSWGGMAALVIVGGVLFSGGEEKPREIAPSAPIQNGVIPSLGTTENPSSAYELKVEAQPIVHEAVHNNDLSPQANPHRQTATADAPPDNETLLTPTSICAKESNLFSRNNCEWKECAKAEFTELTECTHKKSKEEIFGG